MKTDNHKILVMSAVTATVLLLAFQPASAFNPQPEPPRVEQEASMALPDEGKLIQPELKPTSIPKGSGKASKGAIPPPPPPDVGKPRAMEPLDKK